jgi:DNA topoisomerase-1
MASTTRKSITRRAAKHPNGRDALTIERRRRGRGFSYCRNGRPIRDARTIERLAALAVPPAYVDVAYAANPAAPLQAMGRDAAGRWQYRYHPDFVKVRERRKHRHLARLVEVLPRIRRRVTGLLSTQEPTREFALAAAVALVDASGIRAGTSRHARLSGARGAVTLLKSNVRVAGRSITLAFKAKGGKQVVKDVKAPHLVRAIKVLQRLPGRRLFLYRDGDRVGAIRARDVNAFLCDVASCRISLKDFRTLRASLAVAKALARTERGGSERRRKRQIKQAIEAAAEDLANTATICRKSYVHEAVIEAFEKGTLNGAVKSSNGRTPAARRILAGVLHAQAVR